MQPLNHSGDQKYIVGKEQKHKARKERRGETTDAIAGYCTRPTTDDRRVMSLTVVEKSEAHFFGLFMYKQHPRTTDAKW